MRGRESLAGLISLAENLAISLGKGTKDCGKGQFRNESYTALNEKKYFVNISLV